MKRFMWSFLALLIVACVGVYLAGGFECFAASPGTAGAAIPGDRTKAYITLGILIVAALLFVTEALPLPITAMLVPVGLSSTGVLTSKVAFSYFGDNTVVLFMAMFIIGESTFVTGFADRVGQMALKLSKGDMKKLLLFSMIAVGGLSTVLSNTGTTAVAVPMIMGMCASAKVAPSKILMPVAFASSLGGTVTLVGTPPNGIINSMLDQVGIPQFGFFEFGKFGLILFAVGMLYYWAFGYRLLPEDKGGEDHSFGSELKERRTAKMPYSMGIFAFVVIMMVTGALPLTTAAVLGACLVVATRCMTMKEAFHCIDWVTIFLFAGMLSMSAAMQKSGAAALVANAVVSNVSGPTMLMFVSCALTMLLPNFMSNTATAALMAPLALPIAVGGGISPLPLMMGICMSASACFLTPIATPPNTIVLTPGRYTFLDYMKAGWPLQIISLALCVFVIPMIWPF